MFKCVVFILLAVYAFADVPCCEEKERSTSYLNIAIDLISKAKDSIPGCKENKECPESKECPEPKECPEIKATDCTDWLQKGYNESGVYKISPINRVMSDKPLDVFCDMDTEGGGWTVIQRRGNFGRPDDYFYRDWNSYKDGFGDVDRDFWIGNDNIFALTNQKLYGIRFDLQDKDKLKAYAEYSEFWIEDESNKYTMHISNYTGNAGDGMMYHDKRKFTTKDQHNDPNKENCAVKHKGAWWFNVCYYVHLNGLYNAQSDGISWHNWRLYSTPSLIWTEMKIRPKNFTLKFLH